MPAPFSQSTEAAFQRRFFWKLFRDILVDFRITTPRMSVARFKAQIRTDWPTAEDDGEMPTPVSRWVNWPPARSFRLG